ncbi:MAG: amidophosphoribosyltransferase [Actinobacteria bacterium]|nr:MAG: amidophosphoribosyltransferase [Actinomycetota bacterium]
MGAESPKEECGLFGVWAPGDEVARLTYFGLFAQQHRGQESAGIAVSDGSNILVYKDLGLVSQVFNEATLTTLHGDLAVGHTRYSTTGSTTWDNAQPVFKTDGVHSIALGHNGNLVNTSELAERVRGAGLATTDSDIVTTMIADRTPEAGSIEAAAMEVLPELRGAFCFVFMDERSVFAARDPHGVRPLSIGRLPNGFVVASETCALDIVGATLVRDVEPGELVRIDDRGLHAQRFAESPKRSLCVFEVVYLARPDSRIRERSVHEARREMGRILAKEHPADADLVIAVPTTGHSAAQGFSEVSGIPYGDGLYKNTYVGRTFIQPSQSLRDRGVKLKLNPLPYSIRGTRLVVVDDSIVRGTTTKQIVQALREAGAAEVHIRITCPPIQWPCFYGIDMPTRQELIGADLTVEQIRSYVSADSLGYLSLDGMVAAAGDEKVTFCRACFDGEYPIEIPEGAGKYVLEDQLKLPTG